EIEARPATSDHAEVARQTARIRAVLGDSQPVVPLVRLPDEVRQPLSTSEADPALLGGTVLAAAEWMMDRSRVRPAVGRLWDVWPGAELRGADPDPAGLVVAQAPHRPGSRWIGLPGADAKAAEATSSWVIHRSVGQGRT